MYGFILSHLVTWLGAIAALRYPLIGLQVYVCLAILRPQFIFAFAGDLSGLSQIVGVAVLVGWAINGFGSWRLGAAGGIVVAFVAYIVWFALSALQARDPTVAFGMLIVLFKFALPFLAGVTLMEGEKDWGRMLWTVVLAQAYVAFELNLDYLFKRVNTAAVGFGGMDNNCFAVSLLVVIGPALSLMMSSKTWKAQALAGVSAALILHTIMLTFSRGAMVGMIAVGATLFVMMPKRPKYLAALLVVALVAARFTGPQLIARYASAFVSTGERDGSAQSRVDLWSDCFRVISEYPIFGVGPANWPLIARDYGWSAGKSAHSVWVESATELGVPGAALLLGFFLIAARRLWPVARARITGANAMEVAMASGVVLSVIGFVVAGQFVSVPGLEAPYYVVMVGAAILKTKQRQPVVQTARQVTRWSPPSGAPLRTLPTQPSVPVK